LSKTKTRALTAFVAICPEGIMRIQRVFAFLDSVTLGLTAFTFSPVTLATKVHPNIGQIISCSTSFARQCSACLAITSTSHRNCSTWNISGTASRFRFVPRGTT
jgi:hypothetical protein